MENSIKLLLILLGISVKLLLGMSYFLRYIMIIEQNLAMYIYVSSVLKETMSHIVYKYTHFYCEVLYIIKY